MAFDDMTQKQFEEAVELNGMSFIGFMGYVKVAEGYSVSHLSAGRTRRAKLTYLLKVREEILSIPNEA